MVRIAIELGPVHKKISLESRKRGQYALVNQAMADMNQFVPMEEGILRMATSIDIDGSGINYNMPYAKPQFYGMINGSRIHNYTTPGTGRRWDLRAKAKYMDDWKYAYVRGADW